MTVITISRQYGSGGDEIAHRVGEILNYKHFDKRQIAQAAIETGLSGQEVVDYSEESHKVQGFLNRLFNPHANAPVGRTWREDASGIRIVEEVRMSEEAAISLVQKAIRGAALAGNMIIVGRGGQMVLSDEPGAFHVRIEAPMEARIARVKEQVRLELPPDLPDTAVALRVQDRIVVKDAASADYLKRYYHVDWADPLLYHMVLNTGRMSVYQAAEIIVMAIREMEGVGQKVDR